MTYEKGEASGPKVQNCYTCEEDGHYANQCPMKDKGKMPTVNMVTTEVQQVTTRSKAKQSEWDLQEEVRKAAKEWVNKGNNTIVS